MIQVKSNLYIPANSLAEACASCKGIDLRNAVVRCPWSLASYFHSKQTSIDDRVRRHLLAHMQVISKRLDLPIRNELECRRIQSRQAASRVWKTLSVLIEGLTRMDTTSKWQKHVARLARKKLHAQIEALPVTVLFAAWFETNIALSLIAKSQTKFWLATDQQLAEVYTLAISEQAIRNLTFRQKVARIAKFLKRLMQGLKPSRQFAVWKLVGAPNPEYRNLYLDAVLDAPPLAELEDVDNWTPEELKSEMECRVTLHDLMRSLQDINEDKTTE